MSAILRQGREATILRQNSGTKKHIFHLVAIIQCLEATKEAPTLNLTKRMSLNPIQRMPIELRHSQEPQYANTFHLSSRTS